jgi:hypothetical protein
VEQVLVRALAVRPDDRYATPGALAEALAAAAAGAPKLTEAQVHAVLQRAAELQAVQPTEDGALTAGAVEQVAAQVGIPPEHVRQALREIVGPIPLSARPLGSVGGAGPVPARQRRTGVVVSGGALSVERRVSREVTAAEHESLAALIGAAFGTPGEWSGEGSALTWRASLPGLAGRSVTVSAVATGGATTIRIEERLGLTAGSRLVVAQVGAALGGLLGLVATLFVLGLFGGHQPAPPMLILPLAIMAVFGGASAGRVYIIASADRRAPELAALADRLVDRVTAGAYRLDAAGERALRAGTPPGGHVLPRG